MLLFYYREFAASHDLGQWLRQGDLGYVFAPRGAGKTWLTMLVAYAVQHGEGLGDWEPGDNPVPVVYLDGEMPLDLTQDRAAIMSRDIGRGVTFLHHQRVFDESEEGASINIADKGWQDALIEIVKQGGFQLVVLDNLSTLAQGVAENDADAWEQISGWLLRLRRMGVTVIVVCHAGRNGNMRGTSRREDMASWIISISAAREEGESGAKFITTFDSERGGKPTRNCAESIPDYLWHMEPDGHGGMNLHHERMNQSDQLLEKIKAGVSSATELADALGISKATVSRKAKKLMDAGKITFEGKGNNREYKAA